MRRLSVASLDSGAKSPVYSAEPYGAEPSAVADRDPGAKLLWADGGALVVPGALAWLPAPAAALASAPQAGSGQAAQGELASRLPGFFQAFARGGRASLSRCLAPGASISGLGGAVSLDSITALRVPQGGRAGARHHGSRAPGRSQPGGRGIAATRHNSRHAGRRPAQRKMVCKGHPCIYAADGNPMATWFASPWAVPRGLRSPRKLTDVHGREG